MSDQPRQFRVRPGDDANASADEIRAALASSQQPIHLHFDSIKSIGVENIVDLETHAINKVFNSVSHYLRFHGGGEVRFSYDAEGRMLEFEATNVAARIVDGERLVLMRKTDDAADGGADA